MFFGKLILLLLLALGLGFLVAGLCDLTSGEETDGILQILSGIVLTGFALLFL